MAPPATAEGTGAAGAVASPDVLPSGTPSATGTGRSLPGLIRHGSRDGADIALTFDADMTSGMQRQFVAGVTSEYDQRIVDLLRRTHTHATIFLTGLWAKDHPDVVRSLASDPLFELGNHTFDHAAFRTPCYGLVGLTSDRERQTEVTRSADVLTHLTGQAPTYFRFPGGCHTAADVTMVRALGELPVQWDVVSGDAFQVDPDVIVHDVLKGVQPGSIVVMHLMGAPNAPATYDALQRIIPALATRGIRIVSLTTLLGDENTEPPERVSEASLSKMR